MDENTPINHTMKARSQKLRTNMTKMEAKLWYQFLRKYRPHYYRQFVIESFITDFYCPKARLVIELDGSQHYSDLGLKYDKWRTSKLNAKDICVLRFNNFDIVKQFSDVCNYIDFITLERLKELGNEKYISEEL